MGSRGVNADADSRAAVQQPWELSLDALAADVRPQARSLLFVLSCFAPDTPIPVAMVERTPPIGPVAAGNRSAPAGDLATGQQQSLLGSLKLLAARGLVGIAIGDRADGRIIIVDQTVADGCRRRLRTALRPELQVIGNAALRMLQSGCLELDDRLSADWPAWRQLVPHITAMLDWLALDLEASALTCLISIGAAATGALWRSGDQAAADDLAAATTAAASTLGGDHPACVLACGYLAQVMAEGMDEEAESSFGEPPDDHRELGGDGPQTLASQRMRARLIGLQGRYHEAEILYSRLLYDERAFLGDDHPRTLATRHGLARVIAALDRGAEADQLLRNALADQQRVLGHEDPRTLRTRYRLARVIEDLGHCDEAESMFRTLLADQMRVLGDDHRRTLRTRSRLARVIKNQGRPEEAEPLYRELLADQIRLLGMDHPYTQSTRTALVDLRLCRDQDIS